MKHQGGIYASTHGGSFDRVAEHVSWRGSVADHLTIGEWTLTATGGASIASSGGVTVMLHGTPEIDDDEISVVDLAQRWNTHGREFVSGLHGSYAFVALDIEAGRVFAVRDFMGTKPLFWGEHGRHTSVASEAVAIPLLFGLAAQVDEREVDRYLQMYGSDLRKTMVMGASAFPPNTISTVFDAHVVSEPLPVPVQRLELSEADALSTTREVLDRAVQASLRSSQRVTAAVSAGVDSSVVGVSGLEQGLVTDILTSRTVGDSEWDEVPRASLIAKRFDVLHHVVDVEAPETHTGLSEQIYKYGPGGPTAWLSVVTVERAAAVGSDGFLVGHLGDEWLSLAGGPVAQTMFDGGLKHLPAYLRDEVRAQELDRRRIPTYLAWLKGSAIKRGVSYADRVLDQFQGSGSLQQSLLTLERAASDFDIGLGIPFADRRYVAHVLGLPAWQRNRPGQSKWLLRQAYADLLPEPYVTEPIKANFFDVSSQALGGNRTGFGAIWYQRAMWIDVWRQALADRAA